MHYYNGLSAAKRIDISYKTLLRYIEKGRIIPEEGKTPTGHLVISEDQVEALRLEIQHERGMFRQSQTVSHRQSETDIDSQSIPLTDTTLTVLTRELGKLQAKVDVQDARIAELERRIAELEGRDVPTQPETSLYRYVTDRIESGSHKPQKQPSDANSPIPADLPPCTLTSSDFIAQLGIDKEEFKRYMKRGIYGDKLDMTEIKHHSREGYTHKYFTLEQQEKTRDLLRKHGKLDIN